MVISKSCHFNCYLRPIVPALDQHFLLKTPSLVSPAHLMLCAVKSIILCFIRHYPRLHCCFCQSVRLESLFTVTTACVVKISVSYAWFDSPPACFTLLLSQTCSILLSPAVHWLLNCLCVISWCVLSPGLWGCRDHVGSLCKWPAHLQRQVADQQVRLAQNPQDLLQEEQLLHQNPSRRGEHNDSYRY